MSKQSRADRVRPLQPQAVGSLDEIEKLTAQPVVCDVLTRGVPFRFTGRRLTPEESKTVKILLERALPPVKPADETHPMPWHDLNDESYQERKETNRRKARAWALWHAFPAFREQYVKCAPNGAEVTSLGVEEITTFIEKRPLDDDVLETLFRTVISDIAEAQKYVDFILASRSRKS